MTAYDRDPVGTVRRCPLTGDLYTRVTDGEARDWLAVYVATASRIAAGLWAGGDAVELLDTSELPAGLVRLEPVAAPVPAPVVAGVDLGDEMDALVNAVFAPVAGVA